MIPIPNSTETVIIGGGSIGLFTAYYLEKLGYTDFVVLERKFVGCGSSGRCGSGIRAQFADQTNIQMMKESIRLWKETSSELDFNFTQQGYLYLIYNQQEMEQFQKMRKLQNSLGVKTRIISPEEILKINKYLDTSDLLAGAYNPEDGKADPFDTIYSIKDYLNSKGDYVFQYTGVEDIKPSAGMKEIVTNEGNIKSDIILNAAGGWAPKIGNMLGVDIPIEPYRHQAIITEPIKEGAVGPMIVSLTHDDAYFTQSKDGGIVGGVGISEHETPTYDTTETIDFEERVSKAFTQMMPSLRYVRMLRSWGGYYAMTPDGNPMLGEYEVTGHYIASGFSGHGFMMAPVVGKSMAELIANGSANIDLDYYEPARFKKGELREAALQMG